MIGTRQSTISDWKQNNHYCDLVKITFPSAIYYIFLFSAISFTSFKVSLIAFYFNLFKFKSQYLKTHLRYFN